MLLGITLPGHPGHIATSAAHVSQYARRTTPKGPSFLPSAISRWQHSRLLYSVDTAGTSHCSKSQTRMWRELGVDSTHKHLSSINFADVHPATFPHRVNRYCRQAGAANTSSRSGPSSQTSGYCHMLGRGWEQRERGQSLLLFACSAD